MADRRIIYRWLAGGLLWALIFVVLIVSIRSLNIVTRTGRVATAAMTLEHEAQISEVRETAKAFAVEWGTWSGSAEDYKNRLGVFLSQASSVPVPGGVQEVINASVESINKEKDFYRTRLLLHVRRLVSVPLPEAQSLHQVYIPVTREDLAHLKQDNYGVQNKPVPVWQYHLMCIEVPVKIQDGKAVVTGLPVIVNSEDSAGMLPSPNYHDTASPEFMSFVKQFLELYYSGGPLTNFLTPGAKVQPVSGWKLDSISEIRVDSVNAPKQAFVQVTVSGPGVERLPQYVYLTIKADRGSYLVEDLGVN